MRKSPTLLKLTLLSLLLSIITATLTEINYDVTINSVGYDDDPKKMKDGKFD